MRKIVLLLIVPVLLFLGCSRSAEEKNANAGTLVVNLTDLPAEAEKILVTIGSVEVHKTGGARFAVSASEKEYDLLVLKDNPELLFETKLEEGKYTQIRLLAKAGSIQVAGEIYPLEIPSSEVKINTNFDVAAGGTTRVLLDFDAENSIQVSGNEKNARYILRPVILVKSISY